MALPANPIHPNDPQGLDHMNANFQYLADKLENIEVQPSPEIENYYTKGEADQATGDAIAKHDINLDAHGGLRASITAIEGLVDSLKKAVSGGGIATNMFQATFATLDGVSVSAGIWNQAQQRIEF